MGEQFDGGRPGEPPPNVPAGGAVPYVAVGGRLTGQVVVGSPKGMVNAREGSWVQVRAEAPPAARLRSLVRDVPQRGPAPIGRDSEIAHIISWLDGPSPVQVYGPEGIGKSSVLREVAARRAPLSGVVVIY